MSKINHVPSLPIIGSAAQLSKDVLDFWSKNFKKYGNTFTFNLPPNRKVISTCDADVIKQMLVANHKNYRKDYGANKLKMALGNGLLTNEGDSWFKQRRLAQPAFYKNRLEGFFETMNRLSVEHIQEWKDKNITTVMIDTEMMQLTSKIVVETLLGSDVSVKLNQIQNYIYTLQDYLVKCIRNPIYEIWAKYNGDKESFDKTMLQFDSILYKVINDKKQQSSQNDLLSMLMEARDVDTNERMSDKQLRDELLTIYVAGHETSGYALAWTMYNLCKHKEAYQKAKKEVNDVMNASEFTIDSYKKLSYLKAVIDETLRLYPTAYIVGRESKDTDEVNGIEIPKDMVTIMSIYHLHRNPKYWQQADEFIPERFIGKNNPLMNSDAYYPFGAGPRMCIGFYFATMEITIVLAQLLYHFDFELDEDHKVAIEPLVTLKPRYGIKLKIKKAA